MSTNSRKIWLKFLIYLPVILILLMISIIYTTYIFTYIAVLINAETQIPANFLLINTSNYANAKTKGIILFVVSFFFLCLLLLSIMKTVVTNPGYFPETLFLENKLCSNTNGKKTEKIKKSNSFKKNEKDNKNINDFEDLENDKSLELGKKSLNFLTQNSNSEEAENSKLRDIKNSPSFNPFQKSNTDSLFKKSDKQTNLQQEEDFENAKLSIRNFSSTVKESPVNFPEFNTFKNDIDTFYNEKKKQINYDSNYKKRNNEEIIETNKIHLMEYRSLCEKTGKFFYFDLGDLYNKTDISKMNQCGTCQRIKIERSHHCKMCQRCVLKMDHHCPWLANFIGFYNYKFFYLMHLYGTISTGIIFLSYWEVLVNLSLNYNSSLFECCFVTFVYTMNISLMMFLMWLLYVNTKLVLNGESIIEQSDRERFPSTKSFNVYDMGWRRNFTNVFGDRWYKWFIPGFANLKGNGMIYETKKNFYFDKENTYQIECNRDC